MLKIFTLLADWIIYTLAGLDPGSKLAESLHFFIEDVTKIYFLLLIMIYLIALFRAAVDTERIRHYLMGKNRGLGYLLASIFGAITPFCSCSSIPLFSPLGQQAAGMAASEDSYTKKKFNLRARHNFAKAELKEIFSRVWKWVIMGVGLGAALHGFVPEELISSSLGDGQWWSVPAAVVLGIPLYANASGIIPVAESLLAKGLPVGTTMAFMMSVVAASFPEFMMLKQVMKPRLLLIFFMMLLFFFTSAGWIFNLIY
ncbi:MAG: hypothetical protein B6241_02365 [Spirochaetaceae bacterium 4572_59]|nr:MAG: hypothetical protein B6241_02365 [Spirochaetaceae bacterium 4572_59]